VDVDRRARALTKFEQATELPMLLLALAMIPLLALPAMVSLSSATTELLVRVEWAIWAVFATDLSIRTYLAPRRARYLLAHWFDVLIVVLPFLRPLRIARSARVLRAFTALRLVGPLARVVLTARSVFGRHGLHWAILVCGVLFIACAGAVTHFERGGEGSIKDFPTALWWAAVTITTVGYGDTFPVTPEGRGVGIFLMFVGIALFSLITANIAAFFMESDSKAEGPSLADVMARLDSIEARISALGGSAPNPRASFPAKEGGDERRTDRGLSA
jgi:voltage-gated potassium channel